MRGKTNFILMLGISIFIFVLGTVATVTGKVIYVDDSAVGGNDGSSWENAYIYLQDAFADANNAEKPVEIRVAQGVYTPDRGNGITPGDQIVSFQLINGVSVLGGFAGVEAIEPDSRHIEAFKTILSGDLAGDDDEVDDLKELSGHPTRAENAYIIVSCRGTDETAKIDGVTITAGHQYNMQIISDSPTVDNCTFLNSRWGIDHRGGSQQILTNCTFRGHCIEIIHQTGGSLILDNCDFIDNRAQISSGTGDFILRDCSFIDNVTMEVIDCSGENLRLYNCVFKNNISSGFAGIWAYVDQEFVAENCVFSGNIGGVIGNGGENVVISNCIFTGNIGGVINHSGECLVISNCLFVGNRGDSWNEGIYSHSQDTTIRNCTFSDNCSERYGSVLNLLGGGWVSNCIFWNNSSPAVEDRRDRTVMDYCNIEGGWPGEGNIDVDPCFVSPGYWDQNGTPDDVTDDFWVNGDYQLQSQAGHWDQQSHTWVQDDVTSPCIDVGDPNSPIGTEPFPNGGRVNMGTYGAGNKASKSYFGQPVCETIIAGDINGDCVVDFKDLMILMSHWTMPIVEPVIEPPKVWLTEPQDGDTIAWPGPTTFRAEVSDDIKDEVEEVVFRMQISIGTRTIGRSLVEKDSTNGWERVYTWSGDITDGTWTVWVEAMNNEGLVISVSPEITVTLYRP